MLGGADNPNGELLSYIIGADTSTPDIYPSLFISVLPSLLRLMSERTAAVSDDAATPCPPA